MRTWAKPTWTRREIIVRTAHDHALSCCKLDDTFNGRHDAQEMTIDRDLAWRRLRDHQADNRLLRQPLKRRARHPGRPNRVKAEGARPSLLCTLKQLIGTAEATKPEPFEARRPSFVSKVPPRAGLFGQR